MKKVCGIYALLDLRTEAVCWVGQSGRGQRGILHRYLDHLAESRLNTRKGKWVKELQLLNIQPKLVVLVECQPADLDHLEREWISHFRGLHAPLFNISKGGGGHVSSEEVRAYLSCLFKGRQFSPLAYTILVQKRVERKKHNLPGNFHALGLKRSEEARKNISQGRKGIVFSEEHKQHLKEGRARVVFTEDRRKKMSLSMTGKKFGSPSLETRNNQSEAAKKRWENARSVSKQSI